MTVRIQVVKVYDIDVPEIRQDAVAYAYRLQTTEIERVGRLVEALSDNAEVVGDEQFDAAAL